MPRCQPSFAEHERQRGAREMRTTVLLALSASSVRSFCSTSARLRLEFSFQAQRSSARSFSFGSIRTSRAPPSQASAAGQLPDLTISDVSAMFQEVRAHYRSSGEVDEAQACRNLMSTRVKDLRIACCAVRPSPLHGDGLFATREVAEGELLSFFPADALLVWEGGDRERNDCLIFFGAHVPKEVCSPRRPANRGARKGSHLHAWETCVRTLP